MNPTALVLLDYFGIAVFAISGALVAAEKRVDFVTFIFFAVVTGIGGGTIRDLLIGAPVFWVRTNGTLLICIAAALLVWIASHRRFAGKALLWFDAAGMAAYAAYGAAKALDFGVAPVPAFVMGVLTACAGGITRDVIAGRPSVLMPGQLYVTPAVLSAGLFVALTLAHVDAWVAAGLAIAAGFALRIVAITRNWSLSVYRRENASARGAGQCASPTPSNMSPTWTARPPSTATSSGSSSNSDRPSGASSRPVRRCSPSTRRRTTIPRGRSSSASGSTTSANSTLAARSSGSSSPASLRRCTASTSPASATPTARTCR